MPQEDTAFHVEWKYKLQQCQDPELNSLKVIRRCAEDDLFTLFGLWILPCVCSFLYGYVCPTVVTENEVLPHGTSLVLFCNLYYKTCFSQEAHTGTAAALLTHCVFLESLLCVNTIWSRISQTKKEI